MSPGQLPFDPGVLCLPNFTQGDNDRFIETIAIFDFSIADLEAEASKPHYPSKSYGECYGGSGHHPMRALCDRKRHKDEGQDNPKACERNVRTDRGARRKHFDIPGGFHLCLE